MERIQGVQEFVYNALVDNPKARQDDFVLVYEVYKNFIAEDMNFKTVLLHHKELGVPSFASIIRIRRKMQKKYPMLENESTAQMRATAETEYKAYALNN